jgi:tetratricopeptide (TPR) repeat protein
MTRTHGPSLGALLFICLCVTAAAAQNAGSRPVSTSAVTPAEAEKWREDLRYMAAEMPARHAKLFHRLRPDRFEQAVRQLHERIPSRARHQIIVELARLAALVGDGHTNVAPTRDPKIGFRALPVRLYLFKDGLFVRAAESTHADLVGARVLRVGDASAEEAVARAREIISRDNEMNVRFFAPHLLVMPEVLHALGLSADTESARFTVEREGRRREVTLKPAGTAELLPPDTDTTWIQKPVWVDLRDGASTPAPFWLKDPLDKFRFEYLPEARAVYVQMNQVGNKETETLADFTKRLFAFVEANPVEKLILDLRLNRGGNGTLRRPFIRALLKSKVDAPGRLFVLMGRSTWSASQFILNDMEQYTNAVFVGEPSSSKGNAFGDSRRITLPNSQITVRVSVYYWQDWHPTDTRLWTAPHVTAELTSADYRANLDPALRAALDYVPRKSLAELLEEAATRGGAELALKRFREFKSDPSNFYAATEEPLLVAGQKLLDRKQPEQALQLFKLAAAEHPHSPVALFAVGEAYLRAGNREQAILHFEKSLALNPKSYDVSERLRQARQQP